MVRLLYQPGRDQEVLAVIDEFPFLLPDGQSRRQILTEIQAVMEEHRDASRTKLLLCGSLIGQMETLLRADSPIHGRIQRFDVHPMTFAESRPMTASSDSAEERIVRWSVAGGMARYLTELGDGPLEETVCERVLDPRGPLF